VALVRRPAACAFLRSAANTARMGGSVELH
jgi:hypothetical protein